MPAKGWALDGSPLPPPLSIKVHAASLAFAGRPLFAELDVDIAGGLVTCILGPSGVGKSTLLRLVAGLESGAPGTSIEASDGAPLAGRCAWMAQQDLLLPWLDVLGNIMLGPRLRGVVDPIAHARTVELLNATGLGGHARKRPAELSGGMRQRAALARTLLEDRPIVLMDEPFSGLDVPTRLKLQTLAARLLAGRTVLLVTHDPLEALRLGHRIHVMAGEPARLDRPIVPEGRVPRDPGDATLLSLESELLRRLEAAADT
jgi:putative hydroxymethylpyrimidine transport system ATP-binding protein